MNSQLDAQVFKFTLQKWFQASVTSQIFYSAFIYFYHKKAFELKGLSVYGSSSS